MLGKSVFHRKFYNIENNCFCFLSPNKEKHSFSVPRKSGKAHFGENHWIFAEILKDFYDDFEYLMLHKSSFYII